MKRIGMVLTVGLLLVCAYVYAVANHEPFGGSPSCALVLGSLHENYQNWQVNVDGVVQEWSAANDNPDQILAGPIWKVGDVIWYIRTSQLYRVTALNTSNYTMSVKSISGC